MKFRYLVLGGGVGKAIAHILCQQHDTRTVTIVDQDRKILKLGNLLNTKCEYIVSDIFKMNLHNLFKDFDVVISALPAKYNHSLAEVALNSGVSFCDLGGVLSVTKSMIQDFTKRADSAEVSIIPDCGLMPGLGTMIAKSCFKDFDSVESAIIYVGGLPQKPRPPVFYQKVFYIGGLESLCYDTSPVLKSGRIVELPPFSETERFETRELAQYSPDGLGTVEAFISAGASIAPWTFQKLGVKEFCEKTVRWPGFVDFVKNLDRKDFVSELEKHVNIPVDSDNPDLVWMQVVVKGTRNDCYFEKNHTLIDYFDEKTGLTAMERCTGFPTALIAQYLARGQGGHGVLTPDQAFRDKILKEMLSRLARYFNTAESEYSGTAAD